VVGEPDRQWPREATRAFAHEWAAFFATVWRVTRAPRQFAADWADGKVEALNPIFYTLNAVAVQAPWVILWNRLAHRPEAELPLWSQALGTLSEFLYALVWTLPLHGVLRLCGGRRPLRSTYAISLYVVAGPVTFLMLPFYSVLAFVPPRLQAATPTPTPSLLLLLLASALIALGVVATWVVYASVAMAGLMRMRARWVAAAVSLITVASFWLTGWLGRHHRALAHVLTGSS
jgi:hypothetical protein